MGHGHGAQFGHTDHIHYIYLVLSLNSIVIFHKMKIRSLLCYIRLVPRTSLYTTQGDSSELVEITKQ